MKNNDIESQLKRAAADVAPDILDSVLSHCKKQERRITDMTENNKQQKKRRHWQIFAGAAAALVLAISGFGYYSQYRSVDSIVGFDVNPSFELKVSRQEKILSATALNDDAIKILDGMDLTGSNLNVAVNALIGSMMKNGYIDELKNSILVTVENNDDTKRAELQQQIVSEIDSILSSNNIAGSILSQSLKEDTEAAKLKNLADSFGISTGKAAFIQEIISENPALTFEELSDLSINDLNLITQTKDLSLINVNSTGSVSEKSYIGEDTALNAALTHAGLSKDAITLDKVKLDWDNGVVEYEVKFHTADTEYEYDIDALTGVVLTYEREIFRSQSLTGTSGTQESTPVTPSSPGTSSSDAAAPEPPVTVTPQTGSADNICPYYPDDCHNYPNCRHTNNCSENYCRSDKHHNGHGYGGSVSYIDENTMKQIIENKAPGAVLIEWELDEDDGFVVYEGELMDGNTKYEFKIDAVTGEILKWKLD